MGIAAGAKAEVSVSCHGELVEVGCNAIQHRAGLQRRSVDGGFVRAVSKVSPAMRPEAGGAKSPLVQEVVLIASAPRQGGKGSPAAKAGNRAVGISTRARSR